MSGQKKLILLIVILLISITLCANPLVPNLENIKTNYQIFLQDETFPSEYLNSFRELIYKPNVISSFYRTNDLQEEAVFEPISRKNNYYTTDGKLSSTENYNQHAGGQLILYSRWVYQYENNQLITATLESYEEYEILMSTDVHTYYYNDNNLIDYITMATDNGNIYAIDNYSYNDDGLLIRIDHFDGNSEYFPDHSSNYIIYEYDDNYRLTFQKVYRYYEDSADNLISQTSYTYNEAGNIYSITVGDPTDSYFLVYYYIYDENNILIETEDYEVEDYMYFKVRYSEISNDENLNEIRRDTYRYSLIDESYYYEKYTTTDYLTVVSNNDIEVLQTDNLANYPNPFNPETTISFNLKSTINTKLSIYNIKGQLIKSFQPSKFKLGNNEIVWSGKDNNNREVASGIYFIKLINNNITSSKKIVLIK